MKHGFSQEHNTKNNNNSKLGLGSAGTGNSDDFFYIKVSHKPRGDETQNDMGLRKTPTELNMCARLEQVSEFLFNIKNEKWEFSVAVPSHYRHQCTQYISKIITLFFVTIKLVFVLLIKCYLGCVRTCPAPRGHVSLAVNIVHQCAASFTL